MTVDSTELLHPAMPSGNIQPPKSLTIHTVAHLSYSDLYELLIQIFSFRCNSEILGMQYIQYCAFGKQLPFI